MALINAWMMTTEKFGNYPPNYPVPQNENLLFYIQKNANKNTVVYELNRDENGDINLKDPISVFWIKYETGGQKKPLNFLQKKLAYGYNVTSHSEVECEIELNAYRSRKLYLKINDKGIYKAYMLINGTIAVLTNIFVYADESGAFPSVEYIELFGTDDNNEKLVYEKINRS